MFTGIITDIGRIARIARTGDTRVVIETAYDTASIELGASIACSGVCLTVVDKAPGWFAVDVSAESIARTAPAMWAEGAPLNLERAMRLGDELGGHIVTGHVDGVGTDQVDRRLKVIRPTSSIRVRRPASHPIIAAKGSVTVDGVSLTVNAVDDQATTAAPSFRDQHHPAYPGRRDNARSTSTEGDPVNHRDRRPRPLSLDAWRPYRARR